MVEDSSMSKKYVSVYLAVFRHLHIIKDTTVVRDELYPRFRSRDVPDKKFNRISTRKTVGVRHVL